MPNRVVVPKATSLPFSLASFQPEMGRVGRSGQFEILQQSTNPVWADPFLLECGDPRSLAVRQPQHRVPVGVIRPAPESTNNGLDISSLEIVVAVRPDEERFLRASFRALAALCA